MRHYIKKTQPILALAFVATAILGVHTANAAPKGHEAVSCVNCHQAGASISVAQQRSVARECRDCHDHSTAPRQSVHQSAAGRCLTCHSFHEPSFVSTAAGRINLKEAGGLDSAQCRSCHGPGGDLGSLSPAHRVAARLYHAEAEQLQSASPSETCLRCHSNTSTSAWRDETSGRTIAFNTHASHPYSIKVTPGKGDSSNWIAYQIDPRLPLFDDVMECQTCHLLTAGQKDLLIPFETKYDLCGGCHKQFGDEQRKVADPRPFLARR